MKRNLTTLAIVLGGLAFAAPQLRADPPDWHVGIGFGIGGVHVGASFGHVDHPRWIHRPPVIVVPAPAVHVHARVPVYTQVWVPARYEQVFVGYGRFGVPIYRTVCVSPGHYETVITGYRCATCNVGL